ncbi:hypothetical protein SDC9_168446 [bioreactor metagenome]|uniref:Uncharacterized protein n=1 Tax=bioreactor metagenome TaxID=1076179 RepID=A0A645G2H2_9ZZZZ
MYLRRWINSDYSGFSFSSSVMVRFFAVNKITKPANIKGIERI